MCLLALGGCSNRQPIPEPVECTPEIEVQKEFVPVPADLTQINENPPVPNSGDNSALLDWAMACAVNTYLYEQQIRAIRDLER